jgi:predicted permease
MNDIRYGYRTLVKNPGFTAVAVLSLAVGIGANTAIFSFIDTVLLRMLPVRDAKSLILFGQGKSRGNGNGAASGSTELFSWREYLDLRAGNKVFADVLAVDSLGARVYATFPNGAPEEMLSTFVSGNYFDMLGVRPAAGRVFDTSVDRTPAASPLAVLSYGFWARRFDSNPAVVGQTFRLAQRDFTIIGVAASSFFGTRVGEAPDMWVPVTMQPSFPTADFVKLDDPQSRFLNLIGRLKPGVATAAATANVNLLYQQLLPGYFSNNPSLGNASAANYTRLTRTARIELTPAEKGLSSVRRRYREPLIVLMAVVALVLAIACANVANLLVALGAKRQREIAVRIAIGAGHGRLMRQLLTEGVLLSGIAGVLGIWLAGAAGRVLVRLISTGPRTLPLSFELDFRVLAFTIAVSLATGLLFAMAPALRARRVDVVSSLKESRAGMASPGKVTFGRAMVAAQVALSLTLLITAGLLLRSFRNLIEADIGFSRGSVLLFKIDSDSSGYRQDGKLGDLYARIDARVSALPGVAASAVSLRSFNEGHWREGFSVPGINLAENERTVTLNFVTPGFFRVLRIPVIAGRPLDERDSASSAPVAVIGETFARQVFGGANPLGRTFLMSPLTPKDQPYTVVGIARDVKSSDVRDKPEKFAYLPLAQGPVYAGTIAVRVAGNPSGVASAVRRAMHDIEPNLPIRWTTTLADEVSDSLVSERAIAELSGFFAAVALLLAAIGLYGTISFAAARRTSEIGIRMALGAEGAAVLGMVLKDALAVAGIGIAIGLPLSLGAGIVMKSLLYGLGSFDVLSAAAAVIALSLVAAVAGYIPARRAAAVDPMVALRYE